MRGLRYREVIAFVIKMKDGRRKFVERAAKGNTPAHAHDAGIALGMLEVLTRLAEELKKAQDRK